jgi:hypothetical protein
MIDQQQQMNVSELQRLNEAILLTMDAIRRVAPHLSQQIPLPMVGLGVPAIDPITAAYLQQQAQVHQLRTLYGQNPWGVTPWGQPLVQTLGQHPLAHLMQQQPFGQQLFGQPFGQQPFGQQPFGQQLFGQHPFTQGLFAQNPYGTQIGVGQYPQLFGQHGIGIGQQPFGQIGTQLPWQTPFGAFGGQFPVAQQFASPVSYGAQRPF